MIFPFYFPFFFCHIFRFQCIAPQSVRMLSFLEMHSSSLHLYLVSLFFLFCQRYLCCYCTSSKFHAHDIAFAYRVFRPVRHQIDDEDDDDDDEAARILPNFCFLFVRLKYVSSFGSMPWNISFCVFRQFILFNFILFPASFVLFSFASFFFLYSVLERLSLSLCVCSLYVFSFDMLSSRVYAFYSQCFERFSFRSLVFFLFYLFVVVDSLVIKLNCK